MIIGVNKANHIDYVLHMYRVIQPHDLGEDEISGQSLPKAGKVVGVSSFKVVSKSARAKKLLHKKIKVNQHIKFDEDGDPVEQEGSRNKVEYPNEEEGSSSSDSDGELSVQPISVSEFERSKKHLKVGGIKIEKAKELLRSRDKMDRKRERERIQAAHRERRLKFCQGMKRDKDNEKMATEGVRLAEAASSKDEQEGQMSEVEGDSHTHSQLSLIEGDNKVASSDEEGMLQPKRQKLERKQKPKKKKKRHEQLGTEAEPPSLVEDEELALHLLMS